MKVSDMEYILHLFFDLLQERLRIPRVVIWQDAVWSEHHLKNLQICQTVKPDDVK